MSQLTVRPLTAQPRGPLQAALRAKWFLMQVSSAFLSVLQETSFSSAQPSPTAAKSLSQVTSVPALEQP